MTYRIKVLIPANKAKQRHYMWARENSHNTIAVISATLQPSEDDEAAAQALKRDS